ncbi:MAG: hypothetical protein U0168_21370 [Nannocystaceae bacterium]
MGQVPVLLVDGEPIADSTQILARIETLGGRSLLPADPRLRAEALLWEELADTALSSGFLVAARWADADNWPRTRAAYFGAMPAPVRAIVPALLRRGVVRSWSRATCSARGRRPAGLGSRSCSTRSRPARPPAACGSTTASRWQTSRCSRSSTACAPR